MRMQTRFRWMGDWISLGVHPAKNQGRLYLHGPIATVLFQGRHRLVKQNLTGPLKL